jgi:hypothetical protein
MALGVDSTSKINEYHESSLEGKGDRCVELTTLPLSCAVRKSWEPQPPGALAVYLGLYRDILLPNTI